MSNLATEVKMCHACESELTNGVCLNADCPEARATASAGATTLRAKQAADTTTKSTAVQERPRSFARTGRPD